MEKCKILIVEDDINFAEATKTRLLEMGYLVSGIVTSAEDANVVYCLFTNQNTWYQCQPRRIVMRKNGLMRKTKRIQFSFEAADAKKVSLVGEFNNWNPDADPMQKDENGTWTKVKMLSPGNKEYKYQVDDEWVHDPENLRVCSNCFGTLNNVARVVL